MPQPKKPSASRKPATRRKPAKKQPARPQGKSAQSAAKERSAKARDEELRANLAAVRERLGRGVMLPLERIQESMDDAVRRGRMTRQDAEDLVQSLVAAGRKQTEDIMADIEQLLGRSRRNTRDIADATTRRARKRTSDQTDKVLRQVDRARRAAGLGQPFPILGFDELTAAQVTARLDELEPADLRKVRDYEKRNANRKSVLGAIERKLG